MDDAADDLVEDLTLRDGRRVVLRPIVPADDKAYRTFGYGLSAETIYYRFFTPRNSMSEHEIDHFLHVDYVNRVALVAVATDGTDTPGAPAGAARIVAVGRYDRSDGVDEAEVAFIVADDYQGQGIGTAMLSLLGRIARRHGITRLVASVLPDNHKMLAVFNDSAWLADRRFEDGVIHIELDINADGSTAAGRVRPDPTS